MFFVVSFLFRLICVSPLNLILDCCGVWKKRRALAGKDPPFDSDPFVRR
jgi:hypothetical protein